MTDPVPNSTSDVILDVSIDNLEGLYIPNREFEADSVKNTQVYITVPDEI